MDYKTSGVDIEAGYKSVELMKEHIKKTMRSEVLTNIGGLADSQERSLLRRSKRWKSLFFFPVQTDVEQR